MKTAESVLSKRLVSRINETYFRKTKSVACVTKGLARARVGKLFTRKIRCGKTVEAAGRTLIGKQGENLFFFFEITVHVRT